MKISVCMAVYNGEKFIERQLASILPQLNEQDEIIVSDNGSTDKTQECVDGFKDSKIKIIRNTQFISVISNFENALKHASGDIIFLADQDDVWLPAKVETMASLLRTYDLVVSDCEIVNAEGELLSKSFFKLRKSRKGVVHNLIRNSYLGCCMAFRREILDVALPFPKNLPMHDMWIGSLAELVGEVYFCEERLMKYRRHGSTASSTASKSSYSLRKKIGFRVNLTLSLLFRYIRYRFSNPRASSCP